jgi:flagellin-like protein
MGPVARRAREGLSGPVRWGRSGTRRGVSAVVATMILLLITVVLFAGLFWFVNVFERPPAQPLGQFSGSLSYGGCGGAYTQVCSVSIVHLSGPIIGGAYSSQVGIYLASQVHPAAFPAAPFSLAQGGIGASWGFGQTWTLNTAAYGVSAPDNITVTIVASNQVTFRVVLEAFSGQAPIITMATVTPSVLSGNAESFNVTAQINSYTFPLSAVLVSANICQLQGLGCSNVGMHYAVPTGLFYCVGTTTLDPASGTYYFFITVADAAGSSQATITVPFTH